MKVVFVEVDTEADWAVASLGPAFIAAFIRRAGHEAELVRAPLDLDSAELISQLRAKSPDVLALSLVTKQWLRARDLVADIRAALDIPVVAGGLHPTFSPEQVLESPGFDYVCLGEGEEPMLELLEALESGAPVAAIRNIQVRGGSRPALRPPFAPIDDLPYMARDLLGEPPGVIHMTTQRGCPFQCTYCAARMWDELYAVQGESGAQTSDYGRRRSIEDVISELKQIRDHGPLVWIAFLDDTFTLHRPWVRDFCAAYKQEIGVGFSILARVETLNEGLVHTLADAGCKMITYGVESGSYRVRKEILGRQVTNERFVDVLRWTREAGIMSVCGYMLGMPGETRDDLEQTLALAAELDAFDFACYVFYPFAGTRLFQVCRQQGLLPDDYLERPANHRTSILELRDLSHADIEEFYQRFAALRLETWTRRHGEAGDPGQRAAIAEHVARIAATF